MGKCLDSSQSGFHFKTLFLEFFFALGVEELDSCSNFL